MDHTNTLVSYQRPGYPFQRTIMTLFMLSIAVSTFLAGIVPDRLPDVALLIVITLAFFLGFLFWRFQRVYGSGQWKLENADAFIVVGMLGVISFYLLLLSVSLLSEKVEIHSDWTTLVANAFAFTALIALSGKRPKNAMRIQSVDRIDYIVLAVLYAVFGCSAVFLSWGQYSPTVIVMEIIFTLLGFLAFVSLWFPTVFDGQLRFLGRPWASFLKFGLITALIPFSYATAPALKGEPTMADLNTAYLAIAFFTALLAYAGPFVTEVAGYGERA